MKEQISMETDSDSDDEHEIDSQSVTGKSEIGELIG